MSRLCASLKVIPYSSGNDFEICSYFNILYVHLSAHKVNVTHFVLIESIENKKHGKSTPACFILLSRHNQSCCGVAIDTMSDYHQSHLPHVEVTIRPILVVFQMICRWLFYFSSLLHTVWTMNSIFSSRQT